MIRSRLFAPEGRQRENLSPAEMKAAIAQAKNLLWVSLEHPTQEEVMAILGEVFHFHPLAIEDCLSTGYQTPKVDDFGSYIFIIAHAIRTDSEKNVETMELNFFLGANYLVTVFLEETMRPVEQLWQRLTSNGSDFLCHRLLDLLVDDYTPFLDHMDDEIEFLEDEVLERPTPQILQRILGLKHTLMYLRRIISPQREVLNRLSRDEFPMIDRYSQIYFRDVYDHMVRYQEQIETLRDIVSGAMDIYLNSTSLRLNNVMKALTIVSTIFLPLSFVAGVYGMNFDYMPELHWQYGYYVVWGSFILIVAAMLYFFKKRGWF